MRPIDADKIPYRFYAGDELMVRKDVVDEQPTISPDEVRGVGEWEMRSDRPDTLICSICYAGFDVWKWDQRRMHYCPRCGARMKGAEDGTTDNSQ